MPDLLPSLREHLASEALARIPASATPVGAAPLWLEPREGVPAPGEGQNQTEVGQDLVLGAYITGGIAPKPYESFLRQDIVDIWMRSRVASVTFAFERDLREALIDRRDWQMGALHVLESQMWRPLQRLESDAQAFTHIVSYLFLLYA